jgi:hypothetical protein
LVSTPGAKLRAQYSGASLVLTIDGYGNTVWVLVGDLAE